MPYLTQEKIALKTYKQLRASGLDMNEIETFARNTGLSVEEATNLKKHIFLTKHINLPDHVGGKYYFEGYFDPDMGIAYGWEKALKGELPTDEKAWFRQLADHELAESKLMKQGMAYRNLESFDPIRGMTGDPPGAHDLVPPPPDEMYPNMKIIE